MANKLYDIVHSLQNSGSTKKRYIFESPEKAIEKFCEEYPDYPIFYIDEYDVTGKHLCTYKYSEFLTEEQKKMYPQTIVGLKVKIELLEKRMIEKQKELAPYLTVGLGTATVGVSYGVMAVLSMVISVISILVILYFLIIKGSTNIMGILCFITFFFLGQFFIKKTKSKEDEIAEKERRVEHLKKQIELEIDTINSEIQIHEYLLEELLTLQTDIVDDHVEKSNTKECPQCAETVKLNAKICRFCNYKFENQ